MQNITLTLARPADLDALYHLCQDVGVRTPSSQWGKDYPTREILQADVESQTLYQLTAGHTPVSIIQLRSWNAFMAGEEATDLTSWSREIHNPCGLGRFCVNPDYQRQGIGRRVLTAALELAKSMGYDGAFLHVIPSNTAAISLYESLGFHLKGKVQEYGFSFLCYEKAL